MTVAEDAEEKSSLEPTKAALPNRLAVLATRQTMFRALVLDHWRLSNCLNAAKVCYMIFFGISLNMSSIETMTPLLAQRPPTGTRITSESEKVKWAKTSGSPRAGLVGCSSCDWPCYVGDVCLLVTCLDNPNVDNSDVSSSQFVQRT